MRPLRRELISLIQSTLLDQDRRFPRRVQAGMVQDALSLLLGGRPGKVKATWRTVTHADIHRHLFTVRCPDQAFFLDGIKVYLERKGIQPLGQQAMVFYAHYGPGGEVASICPPDVCKQGNEMLIVLHVSATLVPDGAALFADLKAISQSIQASVRDYDVMRATLGTVTEAVQSDDGQGAALLIWMTRNSYLMFGLINDRQRFGTFANRRTLKRLAPNLWEDIARLPQATRPGVVWLFLPSAQRFLYAASQLEVIRVTRRVKKTLHSTILMGYFSRSARHANASQLPRIRNIWTALLSDPALTRSAYLTREVRTLFDRIPKPVLLTVPMAEMLTALLAIVEVGTPEKTLLFNWDTEPGSVRLILVAMGTGRGTAAVELAILNTLERGGLTPLHHHHVTVGPHRLLFVNCQSNGTPPMSLDNLRQAVQECAISWTDRARVAIRAGQAGDETPAALKALAEVPRLYQEMFAPEGFIRDLEILTQLRRDGEPHVRLEKTEEGLNLNIFTALPIPLGKLVTIVRHFGLAPMREVVVDFYGDPSVHLTSLQCGYRGSASTATLPRLKEALEAVLSDRVDDDPANGLVLLAGLNITAVGVLITLRGHLVQLLPSASHGNLNHTLWNNPATTTALYHLFITRHSPATMEASAAAAASFIESLNDVQSLSDDSAFRALAELIGAGLRTNAFLRNDCEPIAIKINPRLLGFASAPLPHREIFVHGRHVQGVHLRGGPVARGGIRLSDRPADFRTEVLELMTTQVVKNGMIVPTGAKGGFVVRGGEGLTFVQTQYRSFVRALLSVTDNLSAANVVPPEGMTIAAGDENDTYLVLAADKGTATFSDLANDEAAKSGFWLDDAFASGGSHGYDHKVYGITARGAWVCVQHHFEQMGMDPNRDPISVVAIGDMGGDVFGNGMLQSKTQRLIAAFNHAHIFLDPDPNPAASHRERQRLFDERGGWDAYDPALISPGGGVYPRAAKRIKVGPAAAAALRIEAGDLSGEALVRAILQAPVDLLYNGGIGTYVRASDERDDQVRDPANNRVRISADTLRCKVIGEGGNLGLSQRARIEFAARGGHINTDAIDNSGGVDMSDHEVNLKVLLAGGDAAPSRAQRDRLLTSVGREVADQCLAGNLAQSRTLTLAVAECECFPPRVRRLKERLVAQGHIDPNTDPAMDEAGIASLPLRPQLAILTGHEKNRIKAALARVGFARTTAFRDILLRGYFPARVAQRHGDAISRHPLADEIINTVTANHLVDRFGLFAASHLETLINTGSAEVAQGLLAADYVLRADKLRQAIWRDCADMARAVTMQVDLQSHLQHFAEELLRLAPVDDMSLAWLTEQRRHFTQFRHLIERGETSGDDADVCLIGSEARRSGLSDADCAWLCAMPHLARCGVALQAGIRLGVPLSRCLAANRAAFRLLPFRRVEMQLRDPSWGTDLSHALRGEWLSRLTHMRSRVVTHLLRSRGRDLVAVGIHTWGTHRHWQDIRDGTREVSGAEVNPMRVMLLMTRMESLIDETDD